MLPDERLARARGRVRVRVRVRVWVRVRLRLRLRLRLTRVRVRGRVRTSRQSGSASENLFCARSSPARCVMVMSVSGCESPSAARQPEEKVDGEG